jgi:hypothetical protein
MVDIGISILLWGWGPTTVAFTRPGGVETAEPTAVFDGDVKVRYPPDERLPRHAPAAFRVVAGIARRRDLGGSGRREDDDRE